jgi:hypothetical protein
MVVGGVPEIVGAAGVDVSDSVGGADEVEVEEVVAAEADPPSPPQPARTAASSVHKT